MASRSSSRAATRAALGGSGRRRGDDGRLGGRVVSQLLGPFDPLEQGHLTTPSSL